MFRFSRLSLVHQIAIASAVLCAALFLGLIAFVSYFADRAAVNQTGLQLREQVHEVVTMLELHHASTVAHAQKSMEALRHDLGGDLRVDAQTMAMGRYEQVGIARAGSRVLNGNHALLEELRTQIGADPAVMVRVGNEFVRVATLLKDKDGSSMEGKPLPQDSKEVKALLEGKPYSGVVLRSGKYFISTLEPIKNAAGEVVGALSARMDIGADMERLFKAISEIKVGTSGYVYIIRPAKEMGDSEFAYHPTLAGKKLSEMNNPLVAKVIETQTVQRNGSMTYDWADARDGGRIHPKMVVFTEAPSWGWIVATGSFVEEFTGESRQMRNYLIIACIGGGALLVLCLLAITANRLRPIRALLDSTRRIGHGDLTLSQQPQTGDSQNELDLIERELDQTTRQMNTVIGSVVRAASAVKQAALGLRRDSAGVVEGTSQQSEAAAELASAIEELSASIGQVAESAGTANQVTRDAYAMAENGGTKMTEMVQGMRGIAREITETADAVNALSERSSRISDIVTIIHEIADQTNLLALNAAIEAARAGESGRGFAVVADEVRKLAERTSSSTREIADTVRTVQAESERLVQKIREVTARVDEGVSTASEAGTVLDGIRTQSERTSEAASEIASATREQSAASQSVAQGVERIAEMAENNTRITRHTHQQTEALEELAHELEGCVSRFRI